MDANLEDGDERGREMFVYGAMAVFGSLLIIAIKYGRTTVVANHCDATGPRGRRVPGGSRLATAAHPPPRAEKPPAYRQFRLGPHILRVVWLH